MEPRYTVSVNGKSQGGSFGSEEKARAAASILRERMRVKGQPGEVSVEPKAQAPNAPSPQVDADIRAAFEELKAERDNAVRRALAAESHLADVAKSAPRKVS